jgi:palmitoyltransferase
MAGFGQLSRAATALPGSRQGMASLSGAATVHALMLVCALQFAAVYVPARWASNPAACIIGLFCFIATPICLLTAYRVGPGFLPLATDSRHEWVGSMQRVSRAIRLPGGKEVPEEMALTVLMNSGRFCETCHGARPLRSKHCPLCRQGNRHTVPLLATSSTTQRKYARHVIHHTISALSLR